MAVQKSAKQIVRGWLDVNEPGPSSLNVRELKGMSMRNYTHPPLDSHPQAQECA